MIGMYYFMNTKVKDNNIDVDNNNVDRTNKVVSDLAFIARVPARNPLGQLKDQYG